MRYNPQWHNQDRKKGIHLAAEVVRRNNQLESQSPGLKGDWTKWKGWKGTKGRKGTGRKGTGELCAVQKNPEYRLQEPE